MPINPKTHRRVTKRGTKVVDLDTLNETNLNRSASKPLYVMLTEDQKRRYEVAAKYAGMNMREYVVNALEAQVAQQSSMATDVVASLGLDAGRDGNIVAALQMFVGQGMRLGRIERALEAIQKRVDLHWGPVEEPFVAAENLGDDDDDSGR